MEQSAGGRTTLAHDLLMLGAKVVAIALGVVVAFTFAYGIARISDPGMEPSFHDGDLVFFYRLDKGFEPRDVVVYEHDGRLTTGRVVALGGDIVNIDSQGLIVNGSYQQEQNITDETTQVADGVTFPLTVPNDSVFVLGDNRDEAIDSRIVGCIPTDRTLGTAIGLFRRRGL
jgi:signal peptidase I